MSSNASAAFLQSQYTLTLNQSQQYGFTVTSIANNSFIATNVSETAFSNLTIKTPNTNSMLGIIISVSVSTDGGNKYIPNYLLSSTANEAITTSSSNKGYGKPLAQSFGSSNVGINVVTDVTSELINTQSVNMPKLYKITFSVVSLGATTDDGDSVAVTNSKQTTSGCYLWVYENVAVGLCVNEAFSNNKIRGQTTFKKCIGCKP